MSALVRSMNVLRGGVLCRFNTDIGKSSSVLQNAYRALASFNTTSRYQQTVQFPFLQSRFINTHQQGSSLPSLDLPNSSVKHKKADLKWYKWVRNENVISAVSSDINQGRLFAVVYISGVQHKVTTGDLILLQNHIQADVGDRIRLEKVLLLGGDNFTLIGKPMLSLDTVRVEATVIEKTISEKKVHFRFRRRKRVARYRETYTNLTVLRINSIEAKLR